MEKPIAVSVCSDCPFFIRSGFGDPCECGHEDAPQGAYNNATGPSSQPPRWCPMRSGTGTVQRVYRNMNDRVIRKVSAYLK